MRGFTHDYLAADRGPRREGRILDRGFWLHGVPRLIPLCRLFGHRPVVDGTSGYRDQPGSRWVACRRCGIRPDPQGNLDPAVHDVGQPYTGPWAPGLPPDHPRRTEAIRALGTGFRPPGAWPGAPTGELGGQLIVGRTTGGLSAQVKVGNASSEQVLAAHLCLGPCGALYLHSGSHGTWLQRRLNPTGHDSRVVQIALDNGRLRWRLWARRDRGDRDTPRWRDGSSAVDPRVWLWGPVRSQVTDLVGPIPALVRMPHGDDHQVMLRLQEIRTGRTRRGRPVTTWSVDWDSRHGIATKPDGRGRIYGSCVDVSEAAVEQGNWPIEAAGAIAAQMTRDRSRNDYRPPEQNVPVPV